MRAALKHVPEISPFSPASSTKKLAYPMKEITLPHVSFNRRLFFLSLVGVFAFLVPRSFGGCQDPCTPGNGDCSLPCQICYDDGFTPNCRRCCELQSQGECDSYTECSWTYNSITGLDECRDDPGAACNGVPEVPQPARKIWFLWGALLALLPLMLKRLLVLRKKM